MITNSDLASGVPERVAFVLIDGIGDVNIACLGNKTPLQAAHTPYLDAIAGTICYSLF